MLLRGATLVALDPPAVEAADLRVAGDRITERGHGLRADEGEEVVAADGCLVLPGLVNAHTHLYSALARGMPWPSPPPKNFIEILEKVWWPLDRALDGEGVSASALVGAADAAASGTTMLIDHHSSPSAIAGSLTAIRDAVEEVGLRSVLCYEVTDRNGAPGRDEGLLENARFARGGMTPMTRAYLGAHASFTLSDHALAGLRALMAETGASVHVHVAEDRADVEDCAARYGTTLLERLDRAGILQARTLLAHCVHLSAGEVREAHEKGCWIAHNPRSNMNNSVGYAPTQALRRAALGTDGMDGDMLAEARAAYLQMREAGRGDAMDATLQLLAGGHRLAAALFGLPFGKLDAGAPADLAVLDYAPPTPMSAGNLGGHLLFGMDRSHVRSVMVAGRWVLQDRRLTRVDARAVRARGQAAAAALWNTLAQG